MLYNSIINLVDCIWRTW